MKPLMTLLKNKLSVNIVIRIVIIVTLLIILLAGIINYESSKEKKLDQVSKMSVYNDGSSGIMAFNELLRSFNYDTQKILVPMMKFKKRWLTEDNEVGLIIMVEPESTFNFKNYKRLFEKITNGYYVIMFTGSQGDAQFFMEHTEDESGDEYVVFENVDNTLSRIHENPYGIWDDMMTLELPGKQRIIGEFEDWETVCGDDAGPIVIERRHGDGKIIIVSDSQFLSNYYIGKVNNGVFAYKLVEYYLEQIPNKVIYFDEYAHGFRKRYSYVYFLAQKRYLFLIIHILLLTLLYFFTKQLKFGQYKYPIKHKRGKVYYFSEGISGLLSKPWYAKNIFKDMVDNYKKLTMIKDQYTTVKAGDIDDFMTTYAEKRKGMGMVVKFFKFIKNRSHHNS